MEEEAGPPRSAEWLHRYALPKRGKRPASRLRELSQCDLEQLCPQTQHSQITTDSPGPCSPFVFRDRWPPQHTCGLGVIKDLHVHLEVVKTEIVSTPKPLGP